jgi:hypothetical protein
VLIAKTQPYKRSQQGRVGALDAKELTYKPAPVNAPKGVWSDRHLPLDSAVDAS